MRYQFRPPCGASLLFACLVLAAPLQAAAEDANLGEFVDRTALRVCADPNNLPFSNDRLEGFENKIAELMGQKLGLPVTYVWYPDAMGFVRNTLRANRCDLIIGGQQLLHLTAQLAVVGTGGVEPGAALRWRALDQLQIQRLRLLVAVARGAHADSLRLSQARACCHSR